MGGRQASEALAMRLMSVSMAPSQPRFGSQSDPALSRRGRLSPRLGL